MFYKYLSVIIKEEWGVFDMANDVLFKTKAFGGFKKDEVMNYINGLLAEKSGLENQVSNLNIASLNLNQKIRELEVEVSAQNGFKTENESLKNEIEALKSENEIIGSLKSEIEALKNSLNDEVLKNDELKAKLAENENAAIERDALALENVALKNECEKMKSMEQQVGAAMLDARLRSDELVKEAHEKANKVTKEIYSAIGDTALRIDSLSADIGEIARNFTKAVEEVELRINVLTGNMSKTAQALISENIMTETSVLKENVESNINTDNDDDSEVIYIIDDKSTEE